MLHFFKYFFILKKVYSLKSNEFLKRKNKKRKLFFIIHSFFLNKEIVFPWNSLYFFQKLFFHTRETPLHSNRDHSHAIYYFFQKGQRACVYFVFLLILRLYYTFFSRFFWHTFGQLFVYTTFSAEYIGFLNLIYI